MFVNENIHGKQFIITKRDQKERPCPYTSHFNTQSVASHKDVYGTFFSTVYNNVTTTVLLTEPKCCDTDNKSANGHDPEPVPSA
jgi:hypothetical protein